MLNTNVFFCLIFTPIHLVFDFLIFVYIYIYIYIYIIKTIPIKLVKY